VKDLAQPITAAQVAKLFAQRTACLPMNSPSITPTLLG
jgi:hypothetical protein